MARFSQRPASVEWEATMDQKCSVWSGQLEQLSDDFIQMVFDLITQSVERHLLEPNES